MLNVLPNKFSGKQAADILLKSSFIDRDDF